MQREGNVLAFIYAQGTVVTPGLLVSSFLLIKSALFLFVLIKMWMIVDMQDISIAVVCTF